MEQIEAEKIRKEVSKKIRLPKEEKYKIYGKMFINLLLAVAVLVYFIFLNLGYLKLDVETFKADLKVFAIILLGFTIYFMEKAWKTERGTYIVHAAELLLLSIITLYMPYVYFYQNKIAQFLFTTASIYLTIYYMIKCICIYIIYKRRYIKNVSDVRDLVKDEKISYLDEKSSKQFKKDEKNATRTSKKKPTRKPASKPKTTTVAKVANSKKAENTKNTENTKKTSTTAAKKKSNTTSKTTKVATKKTTKTNEDEAKAKTKIKDESEEKPKVTRTAKTAKPKVKEEKIEEKIEEKPKVAKSSKPKEKVEEKVEEKPKVAKSRTTKSGATKKTTTTKKTATKKAPTKKTTTATTTRKKKDT